MNSANFDRGEEDFAYPYFIGNWKLLNHPDVLMYHTGITEHSYLHPSYYVVLNFMPSCDIDFTPAWLVGPCCAKFCNDQYIKIMKLHVSSHFKWKKKKKKWANKSSIIFYSRVNTKQSAILWNLQIMNLPLSCLMIVNLSLNFFHFFFLFTKLMLAPFNLAPIYYLVFTLILAPAGAFDYIYFNISFKSFACYKKNK